MSYGVQNFLDGDVLYAKPLNDMDAELLALDKNSIMKKTASSGASYNSITDKGYYIQEGNVLTSPPVAIAPDSETILEVFTDDKNPNNIIQRLLIIPASNEEQANLWIRRGTISGSSVSFKSWKKITSSTTIINNNTTINQVKPERRELVPQNYYESNDSSWDNAFKKMFEDATCKDYYIPNGTYNFNKPLIFDSTQVNASMRMGPGTILSFDFSTNSSSQITACIRIEASYVKIEGGCVIHKDYSSLSDNERYQRAEKPVTAIIRVGYVNESENINRKANYCTLRDIRIVGNGALEYNSTSKTINDKKSAASGGNHKGSTDSAGIRIETDSNECRIYGCTINGVGNGLHIMERNAFIENVYISYNTGHAVNLINNAKNTNIFHAHTYCNQGSGFNVETGLNNFYSCISSTNNKYGYCFNGPVTKTNALYSCASENNKSSGFFIFDQSCIDFYSCSSSGDAKTFTVSTSNTKGSANFIGCYDTGTKIDTPKKIKIGGILNTGSLSSYNNATPKQY